MKREESGAVHGTPDGVWLPLSSGYSGSGEHHRWAAASLLAVALMLLLSACAREDRAWRPDSTVEGGAATVSDAVPAEPTEAALATVAEPTATPTVVTPPAPLAAVVNGQYIYLAEYERQVAQYESALVEQGLDPDSEEGQSDLALMRMEVLESLIDSALIEQAGADLGISFTDEELEAEVEADIAAGGGDEAFEAWLQVAGLTREDYEKMLRDSLYAQWVLELLPDDIPESAEQVHARHIVLDSDDAARQILTLLEEGADFEELARERSVDLGTREQGGELGWFPRGWLTSELEGAAFALEAGQVSDVIRVGDSYHILQVVEREALRPLSDEVVFDLKLDVFDRWLEEQRAEAVIERYVGE